MTLNKSGFINKVMQGLRSIGYTDDFLQSNYDFIDYIGEQELIKVDVAAFHSDSPSYKTACIGATYLHNDSEIDKFISLGAPVLLTRGKDEIVKVWIAEAEHKFSYKEQFAFSHIQNFFNARRDEWRPEAFSRLKDSTSFQKTGSYDLYDFGLIPHLELHIQSKLDELLGRSIEEFLNSYKHLVSKNGLDDSKSKALFAIVFELLSAKIIHDKRELRDKLDSDRIPAASFINHKKLGKLISGFPKESHVLFDILSERIKSGVHLQNISLDTLAYVYENTFVSQATRKTLGTHATPPYIAELVINLLPLEELLVTPSGLIIEPFCGHAPFLVSALHKLKNISMTRGEKYHHADSLPSRLRGIEVDSFAREIAANSLNLANYPFEFNWDIQSGDIFNDPSILGADNSRNIIVCNPPFERFSKNEKHEHVRPTLDFKSAEAANLIIDTNPLSLGLILPKSFLNGRSYEAIRRKVKDNYDNIEIISFPDNIFLHSEAETVALIASSPRKAEQFTLRNTYIPKSKDKALTLDSPLRWSNSLVFYRKDMDDIVWTNPLLLQLRQLTKHLDVISDICNIHRGFEYKSFDGDYVSNKPRQGYQKAFHTVRDSLYPFWAINPKWMRIQDDIMLYQAHKLPWNQPKIIVNANRTSRGLWRIRAAEEYTGALCYQNFHGLWPNKDTSLPFLSAVINGLVSNLILGLDDDGRRANRIASIGNLPFPNLNSESANIIEALSRSYLEHPITFSIEQSDDFEIFENQRGILRDIDTTILSLYNLGSEMEFDVISRFININISKHKNEPTDFGELIMMRHAILIDKYFEFGLSIDEVRELNLIEYLDDGRYEGFYEKYINSLMFSPIGERNAHI